jgi:hypothetical protein
MPGFGVCEKLYEAFPACGILRHAQLVHVLFAILGWESCETMRVI